MGASISNLFSASKSDSDVNQAATSQQNATGTSDPTFNTPQSQSVLNSLAGQSTAPIMSSGNPSTGIGTAANTYGQAAATGSPISNYTQNPYVTGILSSSDALADQMMQKGEAGVRAQDYGEGDIANLNNQGTFASTFANQQALQDAQTALGQYNLAQSNAMTGASGLAGLQQNQQTLAAQLLAMLRGTATTGTQVGATTGTSQTTGSTESDQQGETASYGAPMGANACWVAREVFGEDNPLWQIFRYWLTEVGPKWFYKLYMEQGPTVARFVRRHSWLKRPIRYWMETRISNLINA